MINYFWGAVLLLHPFVTKISAFNDNRHGLDFFLFSMVICSVLLWGIKPDKRIGILSIFIGWNLLVQNDFNLYYSITQNYSFLIGAIFISHLYTHIDNLADTFHKCIVAMSLIGVFYHLLDTYFHISPRQLFVETFYNGVKAVSSDGRADRTTGGFLLNQNITGAYFAFSIPSFIYLKKLKLMIFPIIAVFFTSAWPVITMLSFFGFLAFNEAVKHKILPYLLAIIAILTVFLLSPHELHWLDTGRFLIWAKTIKLNYLNFKLFGNGLGFFAENFNIFTKIMRPAIIRQEHNEFLAVFNSFGFIGLGLFIYSLVKLGTGRNKLANAVLFSIFINMLCNFTLHMSALFVVVSFWVCISLKSEVRA